MLCGAGCETEGGAVSNTAMEESFSLDVADSDLSVLLLSSSSSSGLPDLAVQHSVGDEDQDFLLLASAAPMDSSPPSSSSSSSPSVWPSSASSSSSSGFEEASSPSSLPLLSGLDLLGEEDAGGDAAFARFSESLLLFGQDEGFAEEQVVVTTEQHDLSQGEDQGKNVEEEDEVSKRTAIFPYLLFLVTVSNRLEDVPALLVDPPKMEEKPQRFPFLSFPKFSLSLSLFTSPLRGLNNSFTNCVILSK